MKFFENDNKEIHKAYFLNFDLLFDKNKYELKSNKEIFEIEIEQLKGLIDIQNDLIFSLINSYNKGFNSTKNKIPYKDTTP